MLYLLTILIAVSGIVQINAACKECTTYGVACVSETQFQICKNKVADPSLTLSCQDGTICTELAVICASNDTSISSAQPACKTKCDICEQGKTFACTSRTTFALCSANTITSVKGTCPVDTICDTSGASICVEKCGIDAYTCDRTPASPTTLTPTPSVTTTPTPSPNPTLTPGPTTSTPSRVCESRNAAGRFPYDNDNGCINYVNCRYQGSVLVAVANTCPTGSFFNKNSQLCETTKPAGCV